VQRASHVGGRGLCGDRPDGLIDTGHKAPYARCHAHAREYSSCSHTRDHCSRFAYFLPQELDNGSILAFFVFRRCVSVQELDNGSILASATDEFNGGQYTDEYYNTLAYLDFCCICENLKNQRSIRAPGSEA
jgi:hypothetical protein